MVVPSNSAELLEVIEALKSGVFPFKKVIEDAEMVILNPERRVRYRHDRRLLLRSGTCKTRENSTALASFPSNNG